MFVNGTLPHVTTDLEFEPLVLVFANGTPPHLSPPPNHPPGSPTGRKLIFCVFFSAREVNCEAVSLLLEAAEAQNCQRLVRVTGKAVGGRGARGHGGVGPRKTDAFAFEQLATKLKNRRLP